MLAFVLGLWACMHGGRVGSVQLINAYFDDKRFPVDGAEVIAQRDIREPIFCPDLWGGYLIYRSIQPRSWWTIVMICMAISSLRIT